MLTAGLGGRSGNDRAYPTLGNLMQVGWSQLAFSSVSHSAALLDELSQQKHVLS
jgi:hypothetical protein